jgi:hypothetical protein
MKPSYDQNGTEIHEFDLLKVFHFIGSRRKKHYMYKWVRKHPKYDYLIALHLGDENTENGYLLTGNQQGTEIIQSPWRTKEELKASGWKDLGL